MLCLVMVVILMIMMMVMVVIVMLVMSMMVVMLMTMSKCDDMPVDQKKVGLSSESPRHPRADTNQGFISPKSLFRPHSTEWQREKKNEFSQCKSCTFTLFSQFDKG